MRDVDGRDAEIVLEAGDLRPHLNAELRVEVGQRFVHEERLRLPDDRAAHRHALPLAARERTRLALEKGLEVEGARSVGDRLSISSLGTFLTRRPKAMLS